MGLRAVLRKRTSFFSIDVDFFCPEGKTLVLVGPSGSGKTTIIRMLAGLEKPDEGKIVHGDDVLFDSQRRVCLPPRKRHISYVFQDYTLFPHLTIQGNAAFAARNKDEVDYLLDYFGLSPLRDRKPHQVSGGEKQRCAICQALARRPQLLLLDEPFSALDVVTRRSLRTELKKIKDERALSVVYVTHDISEALYIADIILPIVGGKIDREWLEKISDPSSSPADAQPKATREPRISLAY